nr:hypothetical protein GCM10025699_77560 [Microbacterium flavescens]
MEVVRRHTATGTVVVAINHTAESRTVALAGTSLLGAGEALEGGIPVPPGAFVVLREPPLPA